jgi:hypothetical protein
MGSQQRITKTICPWPNQPSLRTHSIHDNHAAVLHYSDENVAGVLAEVRNLLPENDLYGEFE